MPVYSTKWKSFKPIMPTGSQMRLLLRLRKLQGYEPFKLAAEAAPCIDALSAHAQAR